MVLNHPPREQSTRTPSATLAAYCHPFQSRAGSRWAGKRGGRWPGIGTEAAALLANSVARSSHGTGCLS